MAGSRSWGERRWADVRSSPGVCARPPASRSVEQQLVHALSTTPRVAAVPGWLPERWKERAEKVWSPGREGGGQ